ncbi:MAG: hypothetical protein MZV70_38940 [Desulfobacterales bacterium]|nr:hypothetical protein [Desulfobacterales bacterium]
MFIGIRKTQPGILVLAPSMHGQEAASLGTDFMGEVNDGVGHLEVIVESRYERRPGPDLCPGCALLKVIQDDFIVYAYGASVFFPVQVLDVEKEKVHVIDDAGKGLRPAKPEVSTAVCTP